MKKSKKILKSYFETGDKPTQQQFEDLIDSLVHQDEVDAKIYIKNVETDSGGNTVVSLSNGTFVTITKSQPSDSVVQDNKTKILTIPEIIIYKSPRNLSRDDKNEIIKNKIADYINDIGIILNEDENLYVRVENIDYNYGA